MLSADEGPHLGHRTARLNSPKSVVRREQSLIY